MDNKGTITFYQDGKNEETWIIRISADGIKFNHERWPSSTPSDFARAFCDILEMKYKVIFKKEDGDVF